MKDKNLAGILALLFGGLGIHRFYLGQVKKGLLYLVFCWTFVPAILAFIDAIRFFTMRQEKFSQLYDHA